MGIFHPKWKPPFREILEEQFDRFYKLPFDDADRKLTQYRWVRGSAARLEQITALFLKSRYFPYAVPPRAMGTHFYAHHQQNFDYPTNQPVSLKEQTNIFPAIVENIIAQEFQIAGIGWRSEHPIDTRAYWELLAPSHTVAVTSNPTAHQQLEAHLFLRDWLKGKLPPAQVSEILNSLRP